VLCGTRRSDLIEALVDHHNDVEDVLANEAHHEGDDQGRDVLHEASRMTFPDPPVVVAGIEAVSDETLGRRPVLVLVQSAP
jgi:hypothetical protein